MSLKRPCDRSANVRSDFKENNKREDRFVFDVTIDDLNKFKEGETPVNTENNMERACRNFELWRVARNEKYPDNQCPQETAEDNSLCEWLCKYVTEIRKSDGKEYTPWS